MAPKVSVFFEGIKRFDTGKKSIEPWLKQVTEHYGFTLAHLRIILCSDAILLGMNEKYLHHDTYTDIITFPFSDPDEPIEGELYISWERIQENASSLGTSASDEMHRVMVHGLLHLMGYDDQSEEQKQLMRRQEDYCLTLRTF